jgi:hypothetical protein
MKEVSFFRRRKVLKEVNSLDLHPVRMIGSEKREEENINLLLPRFNNRLASKIFQPHWKEKFIKIKLDAFGSAVWELCDGIKDVNEICNNLQEQFPGKFGNLDETHERVGKFMSVLYQQKFISFKELLRK